MSIPLSADVNNKSNISTDPLSPECLHYVNARTGENVYTTAIKTVGEILQDYDYGN